MKKLGCFALLSVCLVARAQDPTGVLEGQVYDASNAFVTKATVTATNVETGATATQTSSRDGYYRFSALRVGSYELSITAPGFATARVAAVQISVDRTVRVPVKLAIAGTRTEIEVNALGATAELSTALGNVVTGQEVNDLPLNGRNFAQLGLLQPGVAPMTQGLAEAGGALRRGHAYAVNGQRPESNDYVLDGATNVNAVDGGYALRPPVDAIAEFRILTSNAPAEYGGTSGATTSVVTRSGGNTLHGGVYEFLRNDAMDARDFFAQNVEPLHQNQFGATLGGAARKNRDFFFGYYEGFRDREGKTKTAVVPTAEQRLGDFSALRDPQTGAPIPLINYFAGGPVPGNKIPASMMSPITAKALNYYPQANLGPSLYSSTQMLTDNYDQGGLRLDHNFANGDQLNARYATASTHEIDPLSINGADVPGFPVGSDGRTHSLSVAHTHLYSPRTVQTASIAAFRNVFFFDQRLNHTDPATLGFQYKPTLDIGAGPPFLIVSGYANVGNPITGPRNTTQNTYEARYAWSHTTGAHSVKAGGAFMRTQINLLYGIATNGFFVFAPFPFSDSFASFLTGQSVTFFQGGGQFDRGLRNVAAAGYVQDEWRVTPRVTLTYGVRYEVNTPYTEIRNRMNAFAPGVQSTVQPNAPTGLLFPGDAGVAPGIAENYWRAIMPRVGIAWDVRGDGKTTLRAGYGIFYDSFTNGQGGPLQAPVSALPWTQAVQVGGPGFDIANPWGAGGAPFGTNTFARPATVLTVEQTMRPPYAQNWNLTLQRVVAHDFLIDLRYVGNKGTRVPRIVEANPSVYTAANASLSVDQRRIHAGCPTGGGACAFASVGLIANTANSTYHAVQGTVSREFARGFGFQLAYWFAKSLDGVSSFNLSGSAPRLVSGENDLAQNPFNLAAEHGPSLFDARQRVTFSASYALPQWRAAKLLTSGWQLNTIGTFSSGTPFTVYDSANVSQQGSAPEISGFYSARPNAVSDANAGAHTVEQWVSRSAFARLDPVTQAGQFGNLGRNTVRGPGLATLDLSLMKSFAIREGMRLQFRAECFNVANHANFYLPENDIASPNFGRILQAGSPRLMQLALKLNF